MNLLLEMEARCLKTDLTWTHDKSDNAFVGDLFWLPLERRFEIRGAPIVDGNLAHAFGPHERGPRAVDMLVHDADIIPRPYQKYADCKPGRIEVTDTFMAFLEEWSSSVDAILEAHQSWVFRKNLHWVRN